MLDSLPILLFFLGACFGSFLCCQARRLHIRSSSRTFFERIRSAAARGLAPAARGARPLGRELPKANGPAGRGSRKSVLLEPRSICLHCGNQLKWYDNIPIVSWLFLKGKCRKCHKFIGFAEIYSEIGVALAWLGLGLAFIFNGATSGLDYAIFITTLIFTLPLFFLAIYDGLYSELPVFALIITIMLSIIILVFKEIKWLEPGNFSINFILNPLFAVLILGGLYLLLYLISKGKWVGDGDWLLGLALGLALASPWLALVTLFLSNFLATATYLIPLQKKKKKQIPFGPFLVIAFVIVKIFECVIIRLC